MGFRAKSNLWRIRFRKAWKQVRAAAHSDDGQANHGQEIIMDEKTKPVPATENAGELTEEEIAEVTGGFNPQPDPPGHHDNRDF
jgi:hypothetical protein